VEEKEIKEEEIKRRGQNAEMKGERKRNRKRRKLKRSMKMR
jgi:hypothetical protein